MECPSMSKEYHWIILFWLTERSSKAHIDGKIKHIGNFTRTKDLYDEGIVTNQLPYNKKKLNFPEGMPIEDQYDDDDGYWM